MKKIPDKDVVIKVSVCPKYQKIVMASVKHLMDKRTIDEFVKEVMLYNLSVKEQPLIEFRKENVKFCCCVYT